jgi:hypothetical protein
MASDLPTLDSPHKWVRRRAFNFQRTDEHTHRGIDLPAQEGTPVYAIDRGRVVHATNEWTPGFTGYGKVVVVQADDGTHHLYAHLKRPLVNVGDVVEPGAQIGEVGRTQYTRDDHEKLMTSGPHLHLEVNEHAYPMKPEAPRLDPVAYLEAGRVHPLKRYVFGGGSIPEAPEGTGDAEPPFVQPFVAPAGRGLFFRLQGRCPHCFLPFSAAALVEVDKP